MKPGDIYLALFPFGDAPGMKLRPVLVLVAPVGPIPEVLVAYISSAIPGTTLPTDLMIDPSHKDFAATNLKTISVLRLHKLATIHARSLARPLGVLAVNAWPDVSSKLRTFLNL